MQWQPVTICDCPIALSLTSLYLSCKHRKSAPREQARTPGGAAIHCVFVRGGKLGYIIYNGVYIYIAAVASRDVTRCCVLNAVFCSNVLWEWSWFKHDSNLHRYSGLDIQLNGTITSSWLWAPFIPEETAWRSLNPDKCLNIWMWPTYQEHMLL